MAKRQETPAFTPGDVVMLNSGGPKMTVCGINGDGDVECLWFYTPDFPTDCVHTCNVPPQTLHLVNADGETM